MTWTRRYWQWRAFWWGFFHFNATQEQHEQRACWAMKQELKQQEERWK